MTSYETASVLVAVISLVISTFTIKAAVAAKRAALAAEVQAKAAETQAAAALEQAKHAQTQATAAEIQARAAEKQVDIMLLQLGVDHIAEAIRARRAAYDCKEAVKDYAIAVGGPSGPVKDANSRVMACADALEDIPPVFPKNVRALVFGYLADLRRDQIQLVVNPDKKNILDGFNRSADLMIAAMDVSISESISRLNT